MAAQQEWDGLNGRVVVVTGAGRGLGAAYAQQAAAAGAKVVINDIGGGLHGEADGSAAGGPAAELAASINAAGGEAVADNHDVSDFDGAGALIQTAVDSFGDLDVLINNAGILRDRMLVTMTPDEFDDVIRVHLRGHFSTSRHAAAYWRQRTRDKGRGDAVLIQTTSVSGLHGNVGQFNYSSAKAGIAEMAINAHLELNERYGVRCYAIAPSARTRLTLSSPGAADDVAAPGDSRFDYFNPENVAPFVLWLAGSGCRAPSGTVFGVEGDLVRRYVPWTVAATISNGRRWTFEDIEKNADELLAGAEDALVPAPEIIALTNEHIASLGA